LACNSEPAKKQQHTAANSDEAATEVTNQRIVSVGGVITETLFALGKGDAVVGVDSSSTHPKEAGEVDQVGSHHRISVEGVMALRPTLILANSSTPPNVLKQLESVGVEVKTIEEVTAVGDVSARIQNIANAIGASDEGETLAKTVQADIDKQLAAAAPRAVKVLFVYARGSRVLSVAGRDTAADALITAAGFSNAAEKLTGFRPLNAEAVVAAAPDVLLMMTSGASSLDGQGGALALPGISLTPAGKHSRLVEMDGLFMLGLGPRMGQAIGRLRSEVQRVMDESPVL
jgi:iron complex transport system substrate-binding protein